ncbi:hypothetical protein C9374_009124 [Naegleria lovaniensis]|uniref:Guanylate kinase-like domain-containing protein n=1 Tax=Naegleria lovaniensis TaxID=51637 RepID=A0AA88KH99_NAELO|nr:uncharacterized protein C9374_009124 [Naegleria lovaniensis]KAG2377608.1 hypothetical protein C9374_009124 [Naegleria lovaniensis]
MISPQNSQDAIHFNDRAPTEHEEDMERPLSPELLYREQFEKMFDTYKSLQEEREMINFEEVRELLQLSNLSISAASIKEVFDQKIGIENKATREQFVSIMRELISTVSNSPRQVLKHASPNSSSIDFQEKCMIEVKKEKYLQEHNRYIRDHPLLHQILFDFMNTTLIYQPDDVYSFAKEYFTKLAKVETKSNKPKKVLVFSGAVTSASNFAIKIQATFPHDVERAVGYTTRKPRVDEIEGIHHFFVPSNDEMKQLMKENYFYEIVQIGNDYYGNAKSEIDSILEKDKVCIIFANLKGVQQLKMIFSEAQISSYCIYIKPVSMNSFENALNKISDDENLDYAKNRVAMIEDELRQDLSSNYNLVYEMNDELMPEAEIPLEYEMPDDLYKSIYSFITSNK